MIAAAIGGFKGGFSFRKAQDATAMEAPPLGSTELKKAIEKNQELVQRSGGRLPPLAWDRVRLFAIGGNHTNAFCGAVKAGCITPVAELTEDGSRLSMKKLVNQSAFIQAVTEGLKWTVISYTVEMQVPAFVDFVQAADASPPPHIYIYIYIHVYFTHAASQLNSTTGCTNGCTSAAPWDSAQSLHRAAADTKGP